MKAEFEDLLLALWHADAGLISVSAPFLVSGGMVGYRLSSGHVICVFDDAGGLGGFGYPLGQFADAAALAG
jgi:hypothetical protein